MRPRRSNGQESDDAIDDDVRPPTASGRNNISLVAGK
jgi:hypothetical protein